VTTPWVSSVVTWREGEDTMVGAIVDEFTMKSWMFRRAPVYEPWTPQLPSSLHETCQINAPPPLLSDDVPGTSMRLDHVLDFSFTKSAWVWFAASV